MVSRLASGNLSTRHVSHDGEDGESREIIVGEFYAQMSGVSQINNNDDEDGEEVSEIRCPKCGKTRVMVPT